MLPVVALVGRPNVGKSTLFNVLTRTRDALVADLPGVTRDRHYGVCRLGERKFVLVDTGGLADSEEGLAGPTARQVELAIDEADLVVFVVDARDGLLPTDQSIIAKLRRNSKQIVLAVNKTDGLDENLSLSEFASTARKSCWTPFCHCCLRRMTKRRKRWTMVAFAWPSSVDPMLASRPWSTACSARTG